MTESAAVAKAPTTYVDVIRVPLSDIEISEEWNCRRFRASEDLDGNVGFETLVRSIAREGQHTPVVVRPHPKSGKKKGVLPYQLVSGFQRCAAIRTLAESSQETADLLAEGPDGLSLAQIADLKTDTPEVLVFVRPMSELDRRVQNIAENTQRTNLSMPDIAFSLSELIEIQPTITAHRLSEILNVNRSYIGELRKIVTQLKDVTLPPGTLNKSQTEEMTVLDAWRVSPTPPTRSQMLAIAEAPVSTAEKRELYTMAANVAGTESDEKAGGKSRGRGSWAKNAITEIQAIARKLKKLYLNGDISEVTFTVGNVDTFLSFTRELPPVKLRTGQTEESGSDERREFLEKLCDAANSAFAE
jgi:ParB-like chromosome segregation protein Spo0J